MRYFLEVSYKGTNYAGFQVQANANTIQAEVQKALAIFLKQKVELTGSSRTDAGVHARQNFFHFDFDAEITSRALYNLNALLPGDIAIVSLRPVHEDAHCRFDAQSREYMYYIHSRKDPFLKDTSWFYPYPVQLEWLQSAADVVGNNTDFTSFAKRNSQVFTHDCTIYKSEWKMEEDGVLIYNVQANRFLRGMVRGLVGTMLQLARAKRPLAEMQHIIDAKDCTEANFATPAHGLFLHRVAYSFSL